MTGIMTLWQRSVLKLGSAGAWAALVPIRLLMAWEFGSVGLKKLNGNNWFGNVQENFLFPFNVLPVELSWFLATWTEILGALGLLFGLLARFWAFSLIMVSIVAISGVHWPENWDSLRELWQGYAVSNKGFGNFRIPLLFIAMLWPLVFFGAGKLSIDHLIAKTCRESSGRVR
jgi:putative oxidoreductase